MIYYAEMGIFFNISQIFEKNRNSENLMSEVPRHDSLTGFLTYDFFLSKFPIRADKDFFHFVEILNLKVFCVLGHFSAYWHTMQNRKEKMFFPLVLRPTMWNSFLKIQISSRIRENNQNPSTTPFSSSNGTVWWIKYEGQRSHETVPFIYFILTKKYENERFCRSDLLFVYSKEGLCTIFLMVPKTK